MKLLARGRVELSFGEVVDALRPPLAVSIPEAAKLLGVSERHARSLDLPVRRLGGRVVVVVDELREWLRARPAEAAPEPQDDLDRRADEILEGLLS